MDNILKSEDHPKVAVTAEAVIILLAVASLFLFFFEIFGEPTEGQMIAIRYADLSIAFMFLLEFSTRLFFQKNQVKFFKKNWWQLLAALPVTAAGTPILRGIMLIRIIGLISIGIRTKVFFKNLTAFIQQTYLASILFFVIFLVVAGTFSFSLIEGDTHPEVETVMDSLWWTISSMTTTGVGIEPITPLGRFIGMALMLGGVVTLGVFTASIASYFIHKRRSDDNQ